MTNSHASAIIQNIPEAAMVRLRHTGLLNLLRPASASPQAAPVPPGVDALLWSQRGVALCMVLLGALSGRAVLGEGLLLCCTTLLSRHSALYTQAMAALALFATAHLVLFAVRLPRQRDVGWCYSAAGAFCRTALLATFALATLAPHRTTQAAAKVIRKGASAAASKRP